jgi:ArsR family transcriptional regulator
MNTLEQTCLDEQTAVQTAELFRTLSDPSRVRIISVILDKELSVGTIAEATGLSESAVSHQIRNMRQMRIVRASRRGQQIFYRLEDSHVADLFRLGLEHTLHG